MPFFSTKLLRTWQDATIAKINSYLSIDFEKKNPSVFFQGDTLSYLVTSAGVFVSRDRHRDQAWLLEDDGVQEIYGKGLLSLGKLKFSEAERFADRWQQTLLLAYQTSAGHVPVSMEPLAAARMAADILKPALLEVGGMQLAMAKIVNSKSVLQREDISLVSLS